MNVEQKFAKAYLVSCRSAMDSAKAERLEASQLVTQVQQKSNHNINGIDSTLYVQAYMLRCKAVQTHQDSIKLYRKELQTYVQTYAQ